RFIKLFKGLAGPEGLLEMVAGAANALEQHGLVDGDGPDPDRAHQKPDHDRLDDPMGVPEQVEQRQVGRCQTWCDRLRDVGRIHGASLSGVRPGNGKTPSHARHSPLPTGPKGIKAAASRAPTKSRNFVRTRAGPATGKTEFLAKLVQTRAQHRASGPNEARLCLMGG